MFLDVTAMYLLDLHRTYEEDRRRAMREAIRRGALLRTNDHDPDEGSNRILRVARRYRSGRGSDPSADVKGRQDLNPAPGTK